MHFPQNNPHTHSCKGKNDGGRKTFHIKAHVQLMRKNFFPLTHIFNENLKHEEIIERYRCS